MTERRQFIGYDTDVLSTFVGEDREIILNTTNKSLTVHDGNKAGGYETARADLSNVSEVIVNSKATDKEDKSNKVDSLVNRSAENYPSVVAVADALASEEAKTDGKLALKADKANSLAGYGIEDSYTKDEVDGKLGGKADKSTTLAGYGIEDAYTKTEIDNKESALDQRIKTNTSDIALRQTIANMEASLAESSTDKYPSSKAVADYVKSTIVNVSGLDAVRTNCITKIPQDIKLELSNGTLTLKAGSKVYYPNGAGNFAQLTIDTDIQVLNSSGVGEYFVVVYVENKSLGTGPISAYSSGTSDPAEQSHVYYDTSANKIIDHTISLGDVQTSFPICSYTADGSKIVSIDQVFNGFGYIGNTIFALPNIGGLIPDGRNTDGSLRSIKFSTKAVTTITASSKDTYRFTIANTNELFSLVPTSFSMFYDLETNYIIAITNPVGLMFAGICETDSTGRITSFSPKTVFQAVDRNELYSQSFKDMSIGWGLPDYSAGVSLEISTINKQVNFSGVIIGLQNFWNNGGEPLYIEDEKVFESVNGGGTNTGCSCYALIEKGETYRVDNASRWKSLTLYPFKGVNNA